MSLWSSLTSPWLVDNIKPKSLELKAWPFIVAVCWAVRQAAAMRPSSRAPLEIDVQARCSWSQPCMAKLHGKRGQCVLREFKQQHTDACYLCGAYQQCPLSIGQYQVGGAEASRSPKQLFSTPVTYSVVPL